MAMKNTVKLYVVSALSGISTPAMQAVIKQTKVPPTNALTTNRVTAVLVSGAKAAIVEIIIPIDPGFENPQMA